MVLMIVSGRSGSGKSVALRALEDMGFYCVDNLPVVLLPALAQELATREIIGIYTRYEKSSISFNEMEKKVAKIC